MTSVNLPELPKGKIFEECVSAFFQAAGQYIERNIIERDIEEILELDIIATDYNSKLPDIKLIEVKSGNWGFPDMFKIRGWRDYLNIEKGILIVHKKKPNFDFIKGKAKEIDIELGLISKLDKAKEELSIFINNSDKIDNLDIDIWRFSYWIERNLLKHLNHKKKSHGNIKCYKVLENYYYDLNCGIFFTENIVKKLGSLFSTFQKYPHISAKCGNEIMGGSFEEECNILPKQVFDDTYYECKYTDIQISTFIEHRARLAILKNVVDYILYKNAGYANKTEGEYEIKVKDEIIKIPLKDWLLPSRFNKKIDTIAKHRYFYRYPVFWQWFMWAFGGFILKDYEEKEYEILSRKTGIPLSEIPNAFNAYEILFPSSPGGSWFSDLSPNINIKMLKMFPVPFLGLGTNYRKWIYTESGNYEDLTLSGLHTMDKLVQWNDLAVEVLQKEKY